MEVDDEVEEEFDVIYSGVLASETALFQFPLQPKDYKVNPVSSLGINRQNSLLKYERKIDINHLDQRSSTLSTNQVMIGQRIESNTNLCLGVIRDGKLYLNAINDVYQFRHDFSDIDEEEESQVKRADKFKANSKAITAKDNQLEYTPLTIFQPNSISSTEVIEKIVSGKGDQGMPEFLNKDEYFGLLLKYINDKSVTDMLNEKAIPKEVIVNPGRQRNTILDKVPKKTNPDQTQKQTSDNHIQKDNLEIKFDTASDVKDVNTNTTTHAHRRNTGRGSQKHSKK